MATRAQLLACGLSRRQIGTRVASGEYRRLHLGVYLIVPFMLQHSLEMAAVLACGPGSALSHCSAAYLYGLLPYPAQPGPIHVTAPGNRARRLKDVEVHRAHLKRYEIRERHEIPVTAPVRTILDLAGCIGDQDLEAAVAEACALRLLTPTQLSRAIVPGRRGAARLRILLDAGPKRTRSEPERRFLHLLRATGVPEPGVNVRLGRWEVDFYWPAQRLAIEVDAYSTHSSPRAFRRDRRKDAELRSMGVEVQRFAADDLEAAVAWIRDALSRT